MDPITLILVAFGVAWATAAALVGGPVSPVSPLAVSAVASASPAAVAAPTTMSIRVSATVVRPGHRVKVRGHLAVAGAASVAGRLVTYSLYVGAATVASDRLGASAGDMLGSPMGIAFQLAMLALVAALPLIDWRRFLDRDEQPAAQ